MLILELLVLLGVTNGAPVLIRRLCSDRCAVPVDFGKRFVDGRRLLGDSKTWRGVVAAVVLGGLTAAIMGLSGWFGIGFGALAMAGDLLSSFVKRRLGLAPSARAIGLDHLPEALLPTAIGSGWLGYGLTEALFASIGFMLLDIALSPLLYRLGIRREPY